ncbi:MAG TPA: phosphatase PAP2 family protein [Planctomycetaceae bacterium]|nr:phosphatase PAP2 family protein [Planctomycetaceae bacterium]
MGGAVGESPHRWSISAQGPEPASGRTRWLCLAAAALVVAAAATMTIDCPVARWCQDDNCPRLLQQLCQVAESFGHGLGVALILATVWALDPSRRGELPRLALMSWGAGLMANLVKTLVARTRPHHFDFQGGVAQSFGGWMPGLSQGSGGQSFPSAHTATAVGLAFALAWLYPRGRWLFAALAVLVACQRVESGAHFPSDTLAGAAVGCLWAALWCWVDAAAKGSKAGRYAIGAGDSAGEGRGGGRPAGSAQPQGADDSSRAA